MEDKSNPNLCHSTSCLCLLISWKSWLLHSLDHIFSPGLSQLELALLEPTEWYRSDQFQWKIQFWSCHMQGYKKDWAVHMAGETNSTNAPTLWCPLIFLTFTWATRRGGKVPSLVLLKNHQPSNVPLHHPPKDQESPPCGVALSTESLWGGGAGQACGMKISTKNYRIIKVGKEL